MTGRLTGPIRVGLLTPYFAFFESRFPPDYRPSMAAYADGLAERLRSSGLMVTSSGLVDGVASADEARARFEAAHPDVVVVAATMAAPPTFGSRALEGFGGPVIIWDDRRAARFAPDVDEVEATRTSSMLGSIMLANVLAREGRSFVTVSTADGEIGELLATITGGAAAASLRGVRLGLLGGIVDGYGDVVLEPESAARLGIDLVTVAPDLIASALAASRDADPLQDLPGPLVPTDAARPLVARSLRVHAFLRRIVAAAGLDAVALNCHSDVLRWSEELGVVSCVASTMLGASGIPVACTGDAATAVALMLALRISGSAQYCEGYGIESDTGEWLVSSCGMADVALRPPDSQVTVHPNELYPGRHGLGLAVRFDFAAGPATIAAFGPGTQSRPDRIVMAAGELTGRGLLHLNGPSGMFSFDRPGPGLASRQWIDAAPAHHLALMRGDRTVELRAAAGFLGVQAIEVQRGG